MLALLIKFCKHQCFDLVYYKFINFCDVEESPKRSMIMIEIEMKIFRYTWSLGVIPLSNVLNTTYNL